MRKVFLTISMFYNGVKLKIVLVPRVFILKLVNKIIKTNSKKTCIHGCQTVILPSY